MLEKCLSLAGSVAKRALRPLLDQAKQMQLELVGGLSTFACDESLHSHVPVGVKHKLFYSSKHIFVAGRLEVREYRFFREGYRTVVLLHEIHQRIVFAAERVFIIFWLSLAKCAIHFILNDIVC